MPGTNHRVKAKLLKQARNLSRSLQQLSIDKPTCQEHGIKTVDPEVVGEVESIVGCHEESSWSYARVRWASGSVKDYGIGHKGKVQLQFIEESTGGYYYRDHLPILGSANDKRPNTVAVEKGLRVVFELGLDLANGIGSEGHVGTVIDTSSGNNYVVQWDSGHQSTFNFSNMRSILLVFHNAATGITHPKVKCNKCGVTPCPGFRWKCAKCSNIDLCNQCYMNDKHDIRHNFWRINTPQSTGLMMPPRYNSFQVLARGIFKGAKVILSVSFIGDRFVKLAKDGDIERMLNLLENYPTLSIDFQSQGRTALHHACAAGHLLIVEILLARTPCANTNIKDEAGFTALHYAAFWNQPRLLDLLLRAGANVNALSQSNRTALHIAIERNWIECVQILIKYGSNTNIQDINGFTALRLAATERTCKEIKNILEQSRYVTEAYENRPPAIDQSRLSEMQQHESRFLSADSAHPCPQCLQRSGNVVFSCGHGVCE